MDEKYKMSPQDLISTEYAAYGTYDYGGGGGYDYDGGDDGGGYSDGGCDDFDDGGFSDWELWWQDVLGVCQEELL